MSHAVLIVDDEPHILQAIRRTLRGGEYEIHLANGGPAALKILTETDIAVIICDQRMPEMSGAQVLEESVKLRPDAYRITLTGHTDLSAAQQSINDGKVNQFLFKPWDDQFLRDLVRQAVHTYQLVAEKRHLQELTSKQKAELETLNHQLEEKVRQRTKELEERNQSLEKLQNRVEQSLRDIVGVLATLLETCNPSLGIHSKRVAQVTRYLGIRLDINDDQLRNLEFAAHLHDLGKISHINDQPTSPSNRRAQRRKDQRDKHSEAGYAILAKISRFDSVARGVRHQHEWFDGSGGPDGLKGQKIPLASRMIALVNAYDKAVHSSNKDPTKLSLQAGRKVLINGQGKQFDPQLVRLMLLFLKDMAPQTSLANGGDEVELSPRQIKEGMVLSRDLCNANGILMLKQDTLFTPDLIHRVRNLSGVDVLLTSVYVKCSLGNSPANEQNEHKAEVHSASHSVQTLPTGNDTRIIPAAENDKPPSSITSGPASKAQTNRQPSSIPPDRYRGRILIVDDDVLICNALKRDLRRHGFTVVATNDGHDALRQTESSNYDVVITDLMMPGMSGEQLIERLGQSAADLACIILTGNATKQGVMTLAKAPNVAAVLVKPWDSSKLISAITSAMSPSAK